MMQPPDTAAPASASASPARRREHDRAVLSVDVGLESDHNFFLGFTENISEGGLFVATHQIQPVGSTVTLDFGLPGREERIRAVGEVRWVRVYNDASDVPPGMGIRFADISEEDLAAVREFVAQRTPLFWD